jgi:hypothetical protein
MSRFVGEVKGLSIVCIKDVLKGMIVGRHPEARVGLISADGDPRELYDQLESLVGQRVVITIAPEQSVLLGARVDQRTGEVIDGSAGADQTPGKNGD